MQKYIVIKCALDYLLSVIHKLLQFNVFQIQIYYHTNNSKRADIYKAQ